MTLDALEHGSAAHRPGRAKATARKITPFALCVAGLSSLAALGLGAGLYNIHAARQSSAAFTEQALRATAENWSARALIDRAGPDLFRPGNPATLEEVVGELSRIGRLRELPTPDCDVTPVVTASGPQLIASCEAQLTGALGEAALRLSLRQSGGVWKISALAVTGLVVPPKPLRM